ncbi:MAG: HDOD domain-containing protein [bacterium]|nr:HDOD domain-containing protein [bacterium]
MTFLIITLLLAVVCVAGYFWFKSGQPPHPDSVPPQPVEDIISEVPFPETVDPITSWREEKIFPGTAAIQISIHTVNPVLEDMKPDILENLQALVTALPKLPTVAFDVLSILSKPGTGSREVAKIIERDQSTAARLLRWVNSSLFGLDGNVTSLSRAVTLLGIDSVRSLVLEDSLDRSTVVKGADWLNFQMVWKHVAAVSVCTKHLVKYVRGVDADVAATTGLLHDIGLILMLITERRSLEIIANECQSRKISLIEGENEALGFNHQILGEVFCRSWGLPDVIALAIGRHHSPMLEPFNSIAGMIWLADYIVSRLGYECPEGNIPYVDEAEVDELMSLLRLKPPIDHYITEGLIREMLNSTKYWTRKETEQAFPHRQTVSL